MMSSATARYPAAGGWSQRKRPRSLRRSARPAQPAWRGDETNESRPGWNRAPGRTPPSDEPSGGSAGYKTTTSSPGGSAAPASSATTTCCSPPPWRTGRRRLSAGPTAAGPPICGPTFDTPPSPASGTLPAIPPSRYPPASTTPDYRCPSSSSPPTVARPPCSASPGRSRSSVRGHESPQRSPQNNASSPLLRCRSGGRALTP